MKTGDFDRLLLRPRTTALQLAGHELALRRVGRLLLGLIVLAWAISATEIPWDPGRVALLLLTVAGGVAFFFALMVLQATLCFWTTESLEIMNVLTYGGVETAQYPLSIYHVAFRRFFTFVVPLGCIGYFPIVAVLGVDDPLGTGRVFQVLAPPRGVRVSGIVVRGVEPGRAPLHVDGQLMAVASAATNGRALRNDYGEFRLVGRERPDGALGARVQDRAVGRRSSGDRGVVVADGRDRGGAAGVVRPRRVGRPLSSADLSPCATSRRLKWAAMDSPSTAPCMA